MTKNNKTNQNELDAKINKKNSFRLSNIVYLEEFVIDRSLVKLLSIGISDRVVWRARRIHQIENLFIEQKGRTHVDETIGEFTSAETKSEKKIRRKTFLFLVFRLLDLVDIERWKTCFSS